MDRFEEITLGAKYAVRLKDLGADDGLQITCIECRHRAVIPADQLPIATLRERRIVAIEHRLKCAQCGHRGQPLWATVRRAML